MYNINNTIKNLKQIDKLVFSFQKTLFLVNSKLNSLRLSKRRKNVHNVYLLLKSTEIVPEIYGVTLLLMKTCVKQ